MATRRQQENIAFTLEMGMRLLPLAFLLYLANEDKIKQWWKAHVEWRVTVKTREERDAMLQVQKEISWMEHGEGAADGS